MSICDSLRGTHDCVSAQATRTPDAIAVRYRNQTLRYDELDIQSTQFAHHLVDAGMARGALVGVCLPPSFDWLVTMLAIWKAGGVYLPLEPAYPAQRSLQILDDAGCSIVVTHAPLSDPFQRPGATLVYIDSERQWIAMEPTEPVRREVRPDDLAYLMYTSGSTGKPKGVMVPHRALINKLVHPGTWGRVTTQCRAALLASIAFDASLAQVLLPLAHGGSVLVLDEQERVYPERVWQRLCAADVNLLDCTPSWLLAMLERDPTGFNPERIVLGGEVLTPAFARRVRAAFPGAQLVNIYGPTEACIDAAAHELLTEDFDAATIPIGVALPGYRLQVLTADQRLASVGEVGELYIGGVGLAQGYWRNDEATRACFVATASNADERLYRSGDLVRQRADGCIEYVGRADHQIKLRGQRVELGEIESVLAQLPQVVGAVVKAWPMHDGADSQLVGYVVMRAGNEDTHTLRAQLAERLPAHMVPVIVSLPHLPLANTGKVDRSALPQPVLQACAVSPEDLPRDSTEIALVQIWQEVLHLHHVGIHDNFFELGGHSLSAVRLLTRVNARFNTDLPLSTLLAHPTVADLAIALLRGVQVREQGRVITLGTRPLGATPMFLLPPRSGVGLAYAGLARELSGTTPTIALQAVNLAHTPPGSIGMVELVAEFIADVERIQPQGAVRLCGYSAGGPIAYEMARQLLAKGRRVSHLILIDPYCADHADWPGSSGPKQGAAAFWAVCRDMIGDATALRGAAADPMLEIAKRLWLEVIGTDASRDSVAVQTLLDEAHQVLPANVDVAVFLLLLEGVGNLWHAFSQQRVEPLSAFDGQAWFIQPDADPEDFRCKRAAFWRGLVGPALNMMVVPGDHISMLNRARTVAAIGAHLRSVLGRAA